MSQPLCDDILNFWLNRVGPTGWYASSPALDEDIRRRFGRAVQAARAGAFDNWSAAPRSSLALLILLDQFSRNLYRGSGEAFSADPRARRIARLAVARGFDQRIAEPGRQFFFLPFEHSEAMADQNACVALMGARMPRTGRVSLPWAIVHRDVIRRFGRFPHRNKALGRKTTPEEQAFLDNGGFSA